MSGRAVKEFMYRYRDCLTHRMGEQIRPKKDRHVTEEHCCELIVQVFQETPHVIKVPVNCQTKMREVKAAISSMMGCKSTKQIYLPTHDDSELTVEDIQQEACNDLVSNADSKETHRNILVLPCIAYDSDRNTMELITQAKSEKELKQQKKTTCAKMEATQTDQQEKQAKAHAEELARITKELKVARKQISELQQMNKSLKLASIAKEEQLQSVTLDLQVARVQIDELMSLKEESML